jgi:thiol-disulfide isomerase/thioredoxin
MIKRRIVQALCATALLMSAFAADAAAAERLRYDAAAFQAAVDAGKPILVHVTAPWCGECKAQKPIVAALADRAEFKTMTIFDVDFDTQKEALRRLNVPMQSTLVVFKEKVEVARAVGITRPEAIAAIMNKAL